MTKPVIELVDQLRRSNLALSEVSNVVLQSFLILKRAGVSSLRNSLNHSRIHMEFSEIQKFYLEFDHQLPKVEVDFRQPELQAYFRYLVELYELKAIDDGDLLDAVDHLVLLQGKRGPLVVPYEVVTLTKGLLPDTAGSVYCPFESSYRFAEAMDGRIGYEAPSTDAMLVALTRAELLNKSQYDIRQSDPLSSPKFITQGGLEQFEHSLAFPPLDLKMGKDGPKDLWGRFIENASMGYVYQLRHMLAHSSGHTIACVGNRFLLSSLSGELSFKSNMLDKGWLKAVIALPSHLLNSTSIPFNILVLDKRHQGKPVLFIDARSDHFVTDGQQRGIKSLSHIGDILDIYTSGEQSKYSALVSAEEILANHTNLMPSRYVMTEEAHKLTKQLAGFDMINLAEVAEFIRPQMVKSEPGGTPFQEIVLSNLNEIGQVRGELKQIKVSHSQKRVFQQRLKEGDILLSSRGTIGRVGIIENLKDDNLLASQIFTVIRVKPYASITPESIYQFLLSDVGQWQLKKFVGGSAQPLLSSKDLNNIQVPVLTQEQQVQAKRIRMQVIERHEKLLKIRQEIESLNQNAWFTS